MEGRKVNGEGRGRGVWGGKGKGKGKLKKGGEIYINKKDKTTKN